MRRCSLCVFLGTWALACAGDARNQTATSDSTARSAEERRRVREFWDVYRAANAARIAGDAEGAATGYRAALALDAEHEDALYYLGNMAMELGEFDEAEGAWSRLVQVNPASARGYSQLGRLYMCPDRGAIDVGRARANLEAAAAVNAEQTGPLLDLGMLALLESDTGAARRYFGQVLQSNPGSVPASFFSGYVSWRAGDRAAADEAFGRALVSSAPQNAAPVAGEGDTKSGGKPMLARRERCRGLDAHLVGLSGSGPAARRSMNARYTALRDWLDRHARPRH